MAHYDYYFDDAAAEAAIEFFPRYLRHSKGAFAGKPFKLDAWQAKEVIGPFFGWKRKDNGLRRYRTCYLRVPRKNGKSTLCSGVSILALVGEAERGAEVYCAATDKRQASIVFNEAKQMIMASPELMKYCEGFKNAIYCSATNGRIEALSAEAKTKDGLNTFCLIIDEMHAHQNRDLYDVLHTSQGAWQQPIEFIATTSGKNRNSFGYEMDEYALKVRDGVIEDEEFLPVIYGASADDDWRSEETWRKANPGYGVSLQPDYMRRQARQAEEMLAYQNTFRQLHLNVWTDAASKAIDADLWTENTGEIGWQELERELEGRPCHVGLDLSSTTDLTAMVLVVPPEKENGDWYVLPRFFVPADNIDKRARRDRVPYSHWRDDGAMIATEGNVIDYRAIREQLAADADQFRITSIGYDPWNATQLALELQDQGFPMFEFRQGFASMAYPTREFFRLLEARKILHGGHPVLKWCASNMSVQTDAAGNVKPDKQRSTDRIDGVVAEIIAIGRATAIDSGLGKSVYEERGIRII
jgi:phage terminase large subunit-like protein